MHVLFYVSAVVAVVATLLMLTRLNAVHALLYLIVSLLAVAVAFYTLGAPLVAALEVIIYAGAIMVLFVFVVMMLNLGERATAMERRWLTPGIWNAPANHARLLIAELGWLVLSGPATRAVEPVGPEQVGAALFGPYLVGVELASLLLLAGLVGAFHVGQERRRSETTGSEEAAAPGGSARKTAEGAGSRGR